MSARHSEGALHHAARQLPGILVAEAGEADARQQHLGAVAKFALALAAILAAKRWHDLEGQHDVVAD